MGINFCSSDTFIPALPIAREEGAEEAQRDNDRPGVVAASGEPQEDRQQHEDRRAQEQEQQQIPRPFAAAHVPI